MHQHQETGTDPKRSRAWLAAWLMLAAAGCSGPSGPSHLSEFGLARARWRAERPATYQYELRVTCFCPPEYNEWHRILVRDAAIVDVVNVADLSPVPPERWNEWYTIDEIFDRIAAFTQSDIFGRVDATYHPVYGFPQVAELVPEEGIADAGILFTIRAFAAID